MPHWMITRCPYNSPEAKVNAKFLILTGTANPSLADGVARELGVQIRTCTVDKYSDGDVAVQSEGPDNERIVPSAPLFNPQSNHEQPHPLPPGGPSHCELHHGDFSLCRRTPRG